MHMAFTLLLLAIQQSASQAFITKVCYPTIRTSTNTGHSTSSNTNININTRSLTQAPLFMAKQIKRKRPGGKTSNGKNVRKKIKKNIDDKKIKRNTDGKKSKKRESPTASSSRSSNSDNPTPSKKSVHLPPWQIMSAKDIKKNIQSEKERRTSINQGTLSPSITSLAPADQPVVADVSASSSLFTNMDRFMFNWKRFDIKKIESMTFEGAFLGNRLPPQLGVPEVAFLGRSNVGKSSLLNKLSKKATQAKQLDEAVVGKTPGATASVNLYSLNSSKNQRPLLGFADLPGFGYAKLSKGVKESVELAAERYLGKRKELALGILLVDVRRVPSDDDRAVLAALYDMDVPLLVVATKIDKIGSTNMLEKQLEEVRVGLGLPVGQPFCISSVTGVGIKQLWSIIMDACEDKVDELREEVESGGNKKRSEDDAEEYGNIKLDEDGNFLDDEIADEGYEWIQSFAYHDDSTDADSSGSSNTNQQQISEEARMKMKENEDMQAAENETQKVKNLKKVVRKMQREGKL